MEFSRYEFLRNGSSRQICSRKSFCNDDKNIFLPTHFRFEQMDSIVDVTTIAVEDFEHSMVAVVAAAVVVLFVSVVVAIVKTNRCWWCCYSDYRYCSC